MRSTQDQRPFNVMGFSIVIGSEVETIYASCPSSPWGVMSRPARDFQYVRWQSECVEDREKLAFTLEAGAVPKMDRIVLHHEPCVSGTGPR